MDVRLALLAVLSTVPLTACSSTWNCHPPEEEFSLDEEVSAEELDGIVAYYGLESWDEVDCASVCRSEYRAARGWESGSIDSCTFTPPENPDGSGEPGRVICEGTGYEYLCEGRRPLGHVEDGDERCGDPLGRSLAAMAYLEAASVHAFVQLAAQLDGWGAPIELIERCRAAADDEREHARWLTALAEQRGATVPEVRPAEAREPTLFDVALHNAVEGCVHETFAALMAGCRAQRSSDSVLRRVFARIATDETRHGQLAWDLHAWLRAQLDRDQAEFVDAARRRAFAQLPQRARELASLPVELSPLTAAETEAMAEAMATELAA